MKIVLFFLSLIFSSTVFSQDSLKLSDDFSGTVTVFKDYRLNTLAKKEAEFNDKKLLANGTYATKGYRLMVLNTNDRTLAMKVRAQLLQRYPEQKVYMTFQSPYLKLKFGNFIEKSEAEKYKTDITKAKLVTNNIYVVPETVETKVDLTTEKD